MTSVNRAAQFAKVAKVLKKHYKAVNPDKTRPVLEHLLFACCLQDTHYEPAEATFASVKQTFFDYNEVRVTSISELSEAMADLPNPRSAANRFKRVLQAVFEASYSFDLEEYRKKNLGPTIKWLTKLDGTTKFSVDYVVQSALGGHAIPVDSSTLDVLRICDLITDKDAEDGAVPGLERAVSKATGIEFGSMLHQLGADFAANRYAPGVREILLQIDPDCKDRLPKRRAARKAKQKPPAERGETQPADKPSERKKRDARPRSESAAAEKKSASKRKPTTEGLAKRKPR